MRAGGLALVLSGCLWIGDDDWKALDRRRDADRDGFPNRGAGGRDCDDHDAEIYPGAPDDWYDGVDADCDGADDYDADGDGFTGPDEDCDDHDPRVHPGADEAWYDGIDSDCDGADDFDRDGDGYQSEGHGGDDCDDTNPATHPGATETWYDGVDADCDGANDYDADGDGFLAETEGGADCDDTDPAVNPDHGEVCDNGIDDDCDGDANSCGISGEIDLSAADAVLAGEGAGDRTGAAVASIGDIDGDGVPDMLIGAPGGAGTTADTGTAWVLPGPPPAAADLPDVAWELRGIAADDYAGAAVGGGHDLDGDGYLDLVVGAPYADDLVSTGGAVYLVTGPVATSLSLAYADGVLEGSESGGGLGSAVALAGDTDGDGVGEILAGVPWYGDKSEGVAILTEGVPGDGSVAANLATFTGAAGDSAGTAVAGPGDLDGDGVDDVAIGAPYADGGGASAGTAYVFFGPVGGDVALSAADAILYGGTSGDYAGQAVAGGGDVDGDGVLDLLVGAWGHDDGGSGAGAAWVWSGRVTGAHRPTDATATILGSGASAYCGGSVAGAGDVDADGVGDVLVGCYGDSTGGSYAGMAALVLGPVSGVVTVSSAQARMTGPASGRVAGYGVAGPGDVDSDGYDDILVGAPDLVETTGHNGTAYVLFGGGL